MTKATVHVDQGTLLQPELAVDGRYVGERPSDEITALMQKLAKPEFIERTTELGPEFAQLTAAAHENLPRLLPTMDHSELGVFRADLKEFLLARETVATGLTKARKSFTDDALDAATIELLMLRRNSRFKILDKSERDAEEADPTLRIPAPPRRTDLSAEERRRIPRANGRTQHAWREATVVWVGRARAFAENPDLHLHLTRRVMPEPEPTGLTPEIEAQLRQFFVTGAQRRVDALLQQRPDLTINDRDAITSLLVRVDEDHYQGKLREWRSGKKGGPEPTQPSTAKHLAMFWEELDRVEQRAA